MIINRIKNDLKNAMRSKDDVKKNYIRNILSKLTEFEVENGLNRNEDPNDDVMIKVITAHKKSLEKAIKQFEKVAGQGEELIRSYKDEIGFCENFIPKEKVIDIEPLIVDAIVVVGENVGKIMGYIMKNNNGIEGSVLKKAVLEKLTRK